MRHGLKTSDTAYISLVPQPCRPSGWHRIKPEFLPLRHTSLRSLLRAETAKIHAALDTAIGPFDSLPSYKNYLKRQFLFRQPLEALLSQRGLPGRFGAWQPKRIARLLADDMEDLGVALPVHPGTSARPASGDDASLLGMLYVLEGSSLGARLLYKRAIELGLSESQGARHLAPQEDDNIRWQEFLTILEETDISEWAQASGAAVATFEVAQNVFSKDPA